VAKIKHFLLKYDRANDRLLDWVEFADTDSATHAYEEAEAEARLGKNLDVVLVGSDSIETVRITHSNYFDGNAMKLVRDVLDI